MNLDSDSNKSIDTPKIAIITPVLNDARFIEETIQSVISQDYNNIEYIVIDGGSTDQTVNIIQKYEDSIDLWISEPDEGIYDAQNKGVFRSSGQYFAILNSGDFYAAGNVISKIAEKIKAFPEIDFVYANAYLLKKTQDNKIVKAYSDISRIQKRSPIIHPTLFSRTQFFKSSGGFDTSLKIGADYEYIFRLFANQCKGIKLDDFIVYIRQGGYSFLNLISSKDMFFIQKKYNVPIARRYLNYYYRILHFNSLLLLLKFLGEKKFNKIKALRYFRS